MERNWKLYRSHGEGLEITLKSHSTKESIKVYRADVVCDPAEVVLCEF